MTTADIIKVNRLSMAWIRMYLFDETYEHYKPVVRKRFKEEKNISGRGFTDEELAEFDQYVDNIQASWVLANMGRELTDDEKEIVGSHQAE